MRAGYFTADAGRSNWRATTLFSRFEPAEPQSLLDQVCGVLRLMTRHDHVMVSGEVSASLPFLLHCDRPQVIALASALGRFLVADNGARRLHILMQDCDDQFLTVAFHHDGSIWTDETQQAFEEMRMAISRQGACLKDDRAYGSIKNSFLSYTLNVPLNVSALTD